MATETESPGFICLKEDDGLIRSEKFKEVESGSDQPFEITRGQVEDTVNTQLETGKLTDESGTFLQALSVPMVNTPESCKAATVAYFEEGQGLNVQKEEAKDVIIDLQEASEKCEDGEKDKSEQKQEESATKSVESFSETGQQKDTEEIKPTVEAEEKMEQQGLLHAVTTHASQVESEEHEVKSGEVGQNEKFDDPSVKEVCEETGSEKVEYKDEASENCENGAKRKREQNPEENVSKIEIEQEEATEEIKPSVETEKKTKHQGLFHAETADDCITTPTESQSESAEQEVKKDDGTPENEVKNDEVAIENKSPMVKEACEEIVSEKVDESKEDSKLSESSGMTQNEKETESKDEDQEKKEVGDITINTQEASKKCEDEAKEEKEQKSEESVNKIIQSYSEIEQEEDTEEIKSSVEVEEKTEQKGLLHDITDDTESQTESEAHEVKDKDIQSDDGQMEKYDNPPVEAVNTEKASEKCEDEVKDKREESANKNVESFSENGQEDTEEIKPSVESDEKEQVKITEHEERQEKEVTESDDGQKEYSENLLIKEVCEESHSEKVDFKGIEVSEKDEDQEKEQELSVPLQNQGDENITSTQIATYIEDLQAKNYDGEGKEPEFVKTKECIEEDTEEMTSSVESNEKVEQQGLLHDMTTDVSISTQTESLEEATKKEEEATESDGDQKEESDNPSIKEVSEETDLKKTLSEERTKPFEQEEEAEEIKPSVETEPENGTPENEVKNNEVAIESDESHMNKYESPMVKEACEETVSEKADEAKEDSKLCESSSMTQNEDEIESKDEDQEKKESEEITLDPKEAKEKYEHEAKDTKEQKSEESVSKIVQSCSEIEKEEDTEEIKSSVEVEEKTPQAGTTEHDDVDKVIESDDGPKEILDTPSVREVCEETGSETIVHIEEVKHSDSSNRDIKSGTPLVKEECEETVLEKDESEEGLKLSDSFDMALNENEIVSKDQEKEEVYVSGKSQYGGDDVTSSEPATCEDIKETTVDQPVTSLAYCEEEQALSSMPKEILKEEAENKSSDAQEVSEKYQNEAKDKTEEKPKECVNTTERSFSITENTEEIKPSVETDEKEQVKITGYEEGQEKEVIVSNDGQKEDSDNLSIKETQSEEVEFEGVKISDKDEVQENEQELSLSEKSQCGGDDVTSSQNATTVAIQEEQGLNAMPKDIIKEEPQEASEKSDHGSKEELEQKHEESVTKNVQASSEIEQEKDIEEIKSIVETDNIEQQGLLHDVTTDDCITAQTDSQVENVHVVKSDETIQSDDGQKESSESHLVQEVCEETVSEKVEYKEEVNYSDSSNIEIKSASPMVKEVCEETVLQKAESEEGLQLSDRSNMAVNENEIGSKVEDQEMEQEVHVSGKGQGGGDDVTSLNNATGDDITETTIGQHVTTVAYFEEGEALSSMPKEILKEEAEDKSIDAREASEQYENEAKDKIEENLKECVDTIVSSFSEIENTEEIKPSVETGEKKEQVCEESPLEKVEFEGVELSNKGKDQEKEQELNILEQDQGKDDIMYSQDATTVTYFQEEKGLNAIPKDIQKEEAEDTITEEVKQSAETTDYCITAQTKSLVESEEHEVKGDKVVQSLKENLADPSVKEVSKETDSEKVEYKEEVKQSDSFNTEINSGSPTCEETVLEKAESEEGLKLSESSNMALNENETTSNVEVQEKGDVYVLEKGQGGGDDITSSEPATRETTIEETNKNEETIKEYIESDDCQMEKPLILSVKEVCDETSSEKVESEEVVKPIPSFKDEDQETDQKVNMSAEDQGKDDVIATDACSSAQTEPKEETVESEEKIDEAEDKLINAQEASENHEHGAKEEKEQKHEESITKNIQSCSDIEQEEDTEEIKPSVETENTEQQGLLHDITRDGYITAQTESQVESAQHVVKSDKTIQSDDGQKENSEIPSVKEVKEVCEETGSKGQALSSMPIEILKEEAEDKSSVAQKASKQYGNEAKDKIEQQPEECVDTTVRSFSEFENTEEIKPSVETDEKKEQVCEESQPEKVEFDGVELSNKEKEQELRRSENSHGGGDDITSSQNASSEVIEETTFQHATTVSYFQEEQGLNATPIDIQKEEAEAITIDPQEVSEKFDNGAKEEKEQKPVESVNKTIESCSEIEHEENTEEVKPSVEATDDCITAQAKSHVESAEREVKGEEVVQSDDSLKENFDNPLVRAVSEETDSEKVEYKEDVKDKIATFSKDEDQENAQEVSLPEKEQGEDQVTCSQDAAAASEETLHGENYDGEGNEHKSVETRGSIKEDNEVIKTSVETEERIEQEGMPHALTTDVSQMESQEETNENEEKKKESVESDDSQMEKPLIPSVKEVCDETSSEKVESEEVVKAIPTFKDEDQEKDHEVDMSAEDQGKDDVIATDVCSSAQTEPKEEIVENEEKNDEVEDKSIDAQEILEAVEETTTMKLENITEKDFQESECKTNKETEANRDVENQPDRTEDKSVMKDDIILTEKVSSEPGQPTTVSENTEDEVPKKDENLSYDIIEDTKDNASEEEKCFLDGRTRELEPVEVHSGGLDEVSKAESTDLNETTKVEPQDDTTLSSSFGTSIEDTPNLEKEKPESKIFPIEDIESVSEEQIPGVVLKSEDSNLKEECLIPATAISVDEEKGNVTKEISSDEMQMKSAQDQKEIADEISYPDTIPVKNPEVTEVRVDAQIEKEDLEAAEDISCESKASSTIQALETDMMEGPEKSVGISGDVKNDDEDEAPKEDSIPALENVATLEPQVNLPNTESTIVPSESEESSKEALESVCDVQTPEVVADSEDSKVKEWCIVSAQAENMDENNEEELEIRSSENTEKHGEVKPTSESVIEEDQVKETESQPEQSDITSVNIMKDQILESSLDCTSEKNVVDEKRDMEEDVTLAPENQIDNIENQNETIKNAILTDEVAMETEKEKGEDEVEGHVSEKDSCPTSLSNQKELPNEMEYSKPIPVGNTEVTVKAESQIEDDSIDEASKNKIIPVLEDAKALEHQVKIPDTPSNDQDIMNLNEGLPCSTQETIEEKSVLISQLTDREILEEASENRKKTPNLDFTEKELTKTFSEHQNSIKESYIEKEGQGNVGVENKEAKSGNEVVEDVIVNEVLLEVEKTKESKSVKDNINEEDSCLKNQIKSLNSSPDELLETKDSVEDEGLMAENLNLKGETSTTMKGSNEDVEKSREITASEFENSEFMVTEKKIMEEDANKEKETLDEPQADDHAKTSFDSIASSTEQGIEVRSDESRGHSDMHKLEEKAIECSEIQQQHLSTKEATLGSIDQDNQSDAKTTEGTSPEASIPIEDPEAPSVMNSAVGKAGYSKDPNDKTAEVYEAEKGVLKEDMNLDEEGSGVKQVIPSPTEYSENKPLIAEPEDKASGTEPQCSSEVFKEEKKMSDEKEKSQAAEPAKILLSDMLYEQTKGNPEVAENLIKDRETALTKDQKLEKEEVGDKGAKTDEENEEEDEEDDQKLGSCSDAPVMVEASKDMEVKTPKKSHNILSGVGSKVKHSIAKVKKAITGKSSHPKPSSPKETDKVIA